MGVSHGLNSGAQVSHGLNPLSALTVLPTPPLVAAFSVGVHRSSHQETAISASNTNGAGVVQSQAGQATLALVGGFESGATRSDFEEVDS